VKKLEAWWAGLDDMQKNRVKAWSLVGVVVLIVLLMSGCATNQAALITACANAPTVLVSERYDSGGRPERTFKTTCNPNALPQDKTAGYIMQGLGIAAKALVGIEGAHALRDFGIAAVTGAGHNSTIGGDGVMGDSNTAFNPTTTDMTAPPVIVPPTIVEPKVIEVPAAPAP